jgi:hypothetical protein
MRLRGYWREAFLIGVMLVSVTILIISANFQGLTGLLTVGGGVFVGVLGIGTYDTWYNQLAKANPKPKLKSKR